jgi:hypothetical protein|tara:strand:+ start:455 stop:721 length:267 start_codon:yes stop_codon:yes gene_type:complete
MSDSKDQPQAPVISFFDIMLSIGMLVLVGTVIFNTIRVNSMKKEAEKTVAQLCWITEMVFGAPDTSMTLMEACYGLRDNIFESWEALK